MRAAFDDVDLLLRIPCLQSRPRGLLFQLSRCHFLQTTGGGGGGGGGGGPAEVLAAICTIADDGGGGGGGGGDGGGGGGRERVHTGFSRPLWTYLQEESYKLAVHADMSSSDVMATVNSTTTAGGGACPLSHLIVHSRLVHVTYPHEVWQQQQHGNFNDQAQVHVDGDSGVGGVSVLSLPPLSAILLNSWLWQQAMEWCEGAAAGAHGGGVGGGVGGGSGNSVPVSPASLAMLVGLVQKMIQVVHTTAHQVSTAETAAYHDVRLHSVFIVSYVH